MNPTQEIKQFVAKMADNNYRDANDSLKRIIETKLKERVKQTLALKK
jgi:hypothetical protein